MLKLDRLPGLSWWSLSFCLKYQTQARLQFLIAKAVSTLLVNVNRII